MVGVECVVGLMSWRCGWGLMCCGVEGEKVSGAAGGFALICMEISESTH